MKFQHIILKSVFLMVLIGIAQGLYTNVCGVEGKKKIDKENFIQLLEDSSKLEKFLAKIDKSFDDDFKKITDKKNFTKKLNNFTENHLFGVDYDKVSKSPLFLLYSSLKVDC